MLVLPMLGWASTGLIFFAKPGYKAAYAPLAIKTYPLSLDLNIDGAQQWHEVRLLRTVLGSHLLVQVNGMPQHLDPATLQALPPPKTADVRRLIEDAVAAQQQRYGRVVSIDGTVARTDTGAEITLDWNTLKLSQQGRDTALIETLYRIHYLQWTPWDSLNRVLGVSGLLLLTALTILGVRIWLRSLSPPEQSET